MNIIFIGLCICSYFSSFSASLVPNSKEAEDLIIFERSNERISAINEMYHWNTNKDPIDYGFQYDTSLLWNLQNPKKGVTFAADIEEVFIFSKNSIVCGELSEKHSCESVVQTVFENTSPTSIVDFEANLTPPLKITLAWIKDVMIPTFLAGKMLPIDQIKTIIKEAKYYFEDDKTIHYLNVKPDSRIIVVGDIHGQFESTLSIFEDFGFPSETNVYLFNGDVVDRGDKSVECLLMIYAFKIALSRTNSFFMGRGNHESRSVSKGSFYKDCLTKLSEYPEVFEDFHGSFEALPYGFVIRDKIFVTHGGLCPEIELNSLKNLYRDHFNYSNSYEFYAMLWNDPCEESMAVNEFGLAPNSRGPYCRFFNPNLTAKFLKHHGLSLLVRSHQMVERGFLWSQNNKCLTIFSAPNYRGRGNIGAVFIISNDSEDIMCMSIRVGL